MTAVIVDQPPKGEFEEISIENPNHQSRLETLVRKRKPFKYEVITLPNLTAHIKAELIRQGYVDYILSEDNDFHFLVPK